MSREKRLEKTDCTPGGADSSGYKGAVSENETTETVQVAHGRVIELFVSRDTQDGEDDKEEASEAWEYADPVREVSPEAGGVGGVERRAGQGGN